MFRWNVDHCRAELAELSAEDPVDKRLTREENERMLAQWQAAGNKIRRFYPGTRIEVKDGNDLRGTGPQGEQ